MGPDAPKPDWVLPENMRHQAATGEGVYGAYDAFARGEDLRAIEAHAIVDADYARAYADNLLHALRRLRVPPPRHVLDVGCAIGAVTDGLRAALGGGATADGIDLSESAIDVARRRYPQCRFAVCSADELDRFSDGLFDLIHVREFYPFTRTADAGLHQRFLAAFAPKLAPGGVVVAVQIVARAGLADTLDELRRGRATAGYAAVSRHVLVPLRLYRRFGAACHGPFLYPLVALGGHVLDAMRPGRVSYVYLFRKPVPSRSATAAG